MMGGPKVKHKFPVVPDIGLKVHKTFKTEHTYFDKIWKFNVRSQSEANISRGCLTYYKAMWDGSLPLSLTPEDVVLDVGAHVGFFAIPISSQVWRVVAYEPSPANYKLLKRNIRSNKVENVIAVHAAIAPSTGPVTLNLGVQGTTGHSISNKKRGGVSVEVPGVSIVDAIDRWQPTVLKLDCEGAEWDILSQLSHIQGVRMILAELHKVKPLQLAALEELLKLTGYTYKIKSNSWFSKLTAYKQGE